MDHMVAGRMWKLVLAYDGTEFHGWQVQPGHATVQGELRAAIERVTGEDVLPQGAGRTDAGVHALGQVASFPLAASIPPANLMRALNRTLPAAIRVLSAECVADDFHARRRVQEKTYEYRIFRGEICPPWRVRYVYALHQPLDLDAMRHSAAFVCGEHDFTSFAASDPARLRREAEAVSSADGPAGQEEPPNNRRVIYASEWILQPEDQLSLLTYRVRGNGFLHHMVRNLVGTFLEVGRGNLKPQEIPAILEARERARAGATAPARGLFLTEVKYDLKYDLK